MLNYKHILFAVEHDDRAIPALQRVMVFAEKFGAKVSLVHAVTPFSVAYAYGGPMVMMPSIEGEIKKGATLYLQSIAEKVKLPKEQTHVLYGKITQSILDFAEAERCDVIILNGHKHNVLGRAFSTADDLVNQSKCDVIILKD
jgi:universal stress protein A